MLRLSGSEDLDYLLHQNCGQPELSPVSLLYREGAYSASGVEANVHPDRLITRQHRLQNGGNRSGPPLLDVFEVHDRISGNVIARKQFHVEALQTWPRFVLQQIAEVSVDFGLGQLKRN